MGSPGGDAGVLARTSSAGISFASPYVPPRAPGCKLEDETRTDHTNVLMIERREGQDIEDETGAPPWGAVMLPPVRIPLVPDFDFR